MTIDTLYSKGNPENAITKDVSIHRGLYSKILESKI